MDLKRLKTLHTCCMSYKGGYTGNHWKADPNYHAAWTASSHALSFFQVIFFGLIL